MSAEQIEQAARALWYHGANTGTWRWEGISEETRERYRDEARAVIAAIHPTVSTVDELDAPIRSAFENGTGLQLLDVGHRPWIIWEDEDGEMHITSWPQEDDPARLNLSDIEFPAIIRGGAA